MSAPAAARRPCASRVQRLRAVKAAVRDSVATDVAKVEDVLDHSLGGGKGLRALVAHVSCDWCGVPLEDCNEIAAAMEMIHVAALLHDDIVDQAEMRRERPSANRVFGAEAAVLAGDFLYSRASQLLCRAGSQPLLAAVADATNLLAEGEVMQLAARGAAPSREEYYRIIGRKTAALFAACAMAGPVLVQDEPMRERLRTYGESLGLAFQITDDCLDYAGAEEHTGKLPGRDFAEGKVTLPLLYAREDGTKAQRAELDRLFAARAAADSFAAVRGLLEETGALERAREDAREHAARAAAAVEEIDDSNWARMLARLGTAAVDRLG
ncbi:MAG: polyprenyl synthetase family protein [Betaproteobacteria bacterium AqS2]|uniref:Polyprenyl synthetase family protein n=1 Tax=Candidatus Amphirhobacter heronislandensis TaxID=1732024 RepID=A0A930XWB1_9GAMM|nr:polyprenyl synthetase family protein [Betaproteobacteria bacterium AqS2]